MTRVLALGNSGLHGPSGSGEIKRGVSVGWDKPPLIIFDERKDNPALWQAAGLKYFSAVVVTAELTERWGPLMEQGISFIHSAGTMDGLVIPGVSRAEHGDSLTDALEGTTPFVNIPRAPFVGQNINDSDVQHKLQSVWGDHYKALLRGSSEVEEFYQLAACLSVFGKYGDIPPKNNTHRFAIRILGELKGAFEEQMDCLYGEFAARTEETFVKKHDGKWEGVNPRYLDNPMSKGLKAASSAFSGVVLLGSMGTSETPTLSQYVDETLGDSQRPGEVFFDGSLPVFDENGLYEYQNAYTQAPSWEEGGPACLTVDGVAIRVDGQRGVFSRSIWEVFGEKTGVKILEVALDVYEKSIDPLPLVSDTKPKIVRAGAEAMGITDPKVIKEGLSGFARYTLRRGLMNCNSSDNIALEMMAPLLGLYPDGSGTYTRIGDGGIVLETGIPQERARKEATVGNLLAAVAESYVEDDWGTSSAPAATQEATPTVALTETPPAVNRNIDYPEVELSNPEVVLDFLEKCAEECSGVNRNTLFGWSLGDNHLVFFDDDKDGFVSGRLLIEDVWYPIFGSNVKSDGKLFQSWVIPTSRVTPIAPGTGVINAKNVLWIDLSGIDKKEDIIVQFTDPSIPNATPEIFVIHPDSDFWRALEVASLNPPSASEQSSVYPLFEAMDRLLEKGIGTTDEVNGENEFLGLTIDGVKVPGASIDETGKVLLLQNNDKNRQIHIPIEDAADRLNLNADGLLVLNNGEGLNIGVFDPDNPEKGWTFFDYKMANPEIDSSMSTITLEDLSSGKLTMWEHLNPIQREFPEDFFVDWRSGELYPNSWTLGYLTSDSKLSAAYFNQYKISLGPWGLDETGYVITMQYTDKNKQPAFMKFAVNERFHQWLEEKGFFDGGQWLLPGGGPVGFARRDEKAWLPEDLKERRIFIEKMNDNFYKLQFEAMGLDENPNKYPNQLLIKIGEEDMFPVEAENILWLGGWGHLH